MHDISLPNVSILRNGIPVRYNHLKLMRHIGSWKCINIYVVLLINIMQIVLCLSFN
ncbi:hypothetical protein HORM4_270036 [Vibrio harveyi]|nr:hypothetical protein HORM4_270036 [Vibrio harveyi]